MEASSGEDFVELSLDPPPVPAETTPAAAEGSEGSARTQNTEPVGEHAVESESARVPEPTDVVQPTVIRAAATRDGVDGAALTPPSVPSPIDSEPEQVIDLRDHVVADTQADADVEAEAEDVSSTAGTLSLIHI